MQEDVKARERKMAKAAKAKRIELMERIEKFEERQMQVKERYSHIKGEITNRSMEAIKSYRHEVEGRKANE